MKIKAIPILVYHQLAENYSDSTYHITRSDFKEHLDYLKENEYKPISIKEYHRLLLNGGDGLSEKTVLITFDDGSETDYLVALPLLKKFGFTATFFITTDWIDTPGYMSAIQLKDMQKQGMSLQSHAKTHQYLDEKHIDSYLELSRSKQRLEGILNTDVSFLSFPGGRFNKKVLANAIRANYKGVCTSIPFNLQFKHGLPCIGRSMVKYSKGKINFRTFLKPDGMGLLKTRTMHNIKEISKLALGNRIYHQIWTSFNKR